ncbi:MAG: ribonuclease E [Phycisphaerae bacterium]|nr:MAG: ribonuclease E [Phycisphaerae bacterium]
MTPRAPSKTDESKAPVADGDAAPEERPRKSTSTRNRRRRRGKGKSTTKTTTAAKSTTPASVEPTEEVEPVSLEISDDISVITDDTPKEKGPSEGREMIINSTAGAECRIAILHAGRLEEIYIERQSAASHVGNIYKGKITNVESSIQAAFVDFGLAKNGFLHISDVLPKYFPNKADATEDVGKKVPRRDRPPIQKCFRRGDEVIVQVAKEGVGTKGPTLTTYLSIPGRFVVMMPGMSKLGVSRRIEDDADRKAMRDLLGQLSMPDGMGFILRTAGLNRNKRELQSDLNYLNRLWKTVEKRIKSQPTPCELYQESDLVIRTIRDVYSSDFKRIVVDDPRVAMKAKDFLRIAMPRTQGAVVAYQKHEPIFHHYGIEQELQRIYSRHVPLRSGGSIVIDSTEAMVAIDVNSGKYRDQNDAEETAYRINIEAAEEIARQLRLRDLGGLVVCDFIDMRQDRHKRAVEKALRDALKLHKERARILRMSKFGLIEMTRQRQGPSIKRSVFVDCRHCSGSGLVKTAESMSLEVLRVLQLLTHRQDVAQITVSVAPDVCALVLNQQRSFLHHLESKTQKSISILPDPTFTNDEVSYKSVDNRGMPLRIDV